MARPVQPSLRDEGSFKNWSFPATEVAGYFQPSLRDSGLRATPIPASKPVAGVVQDGQKQTAAAQ